MGSNCHVPVPVASSLWGSMPTRTHPDHSLSLEAHAALTHLGCFQPDVMLTGRVSTMMTAEFAMCTDLGLFSQMCH